MISYTTRRLLQSSFSSTSSSSSRLRNVVLIVKDPVQAAHFYVDALGLSIKLQSETMVELDAGGLSIVLKQAGYQASLLTTGYSPIMTFDVVDVDHAISTALTRGAMLDGPIKRPAFGKFASIRSPDGHMIGLFEPATVWQQFDLDYDGSDKSRYIQMPSTTCFHSQ